MNFLQVNKEKKDSSSLQSETTQVSNQVKKKEGLIINQTYLVKERLYKGLFYNTYKGVNIVDSNKSNVIIRMTNQQNNDNIKHEQKVLKQLQQIPFIPGLKALTDIKIQQNNYQVQVFDQKGPNLKMTFLLMQKKFSLKTICLIGIKMLDTIEKIHSQNIIHRNLRPRKILFSNSVDDTSIFITDFKHSKKFRHQNGKLVKYIYQDSLKHQNKVFLNKFSSLGTHLGIPPSQKDDLESLYYIIIYLIRRGQLWEPLKTGGKDEKLKYYEEQKMSLLPETLISKYKIPIEIINSFNYVKQLPIEIKQGKENQIDYDLLRKQFKSLIQKKYTSSHNLQYDWNYVIKNAVFNQKENASEKNSQSDKTQSENQDIQSDNQQGKEKKMLAFFKNKSIKNQNSQDLESLRSQKSDNMSQNSKSNNNSIQNNTIQQQIKKDLKNYDKSNTYTIERIEENAEEKIEDDESKGSLIEHLNQNTIQQKNSQNSQKNIKSNDDDLVNSNYSNNNSKNQNKLGFTRFQSQLTDGSQYLADEMITQNFSLYTNSESIFSMKRINVIKYWKK